MSFTYATLKTAIQDYMENDETTFTNNLDNFIKNTEEDHSAWQSSVPAFIIICY